jgi:hypothetical protein
MLDRPRVLPVVGQLVAGGVAQHVRMDRELDASLASGSTDDLAHRIGAERRLSLAHEYVGGVRVIPAHHGGRRRHQRRHLLVRQVFPAAVRDVRPAQGNFPVFDAWRIAAVWRGSRMGAHGEIKTFDI